MADFLDPLIKRYGPGLPKKGRDRVVRLALAGKKEFYRKFSEKIHRTEVKEIWALIFDIRKIDIDDLGNFLGELPRFTDWCKGRKMPSMIFINAEQAVSLDRNGWGRLVKGFEIKNLFFDLTKWYDKTKDTKELRKAVQGINDIIKRGERLTKYMSTHYSHNSFITTLTMDNMMNDDEIAHRIIQEIGKLDIERFRIETGNDTHNEYGGFGSINRMLKNVGKITLDENSDLHLCRADLIEMDDG